MFSETAREFRDCPHFQVEEESLQLENSIRVNGSCISKLLGKVLSELGPVCCRISNAHLALIAERLILTRGAYQRQPVYENGG